MEVVSLFCSQDGYSLKKGDNAVKRLAVLTVPCCYFSGQVVLGVFPAPCQPLPRPCHARLVNIMLFGGRRVWKVCVEGNLCARSVFVLGPDCPSSPRQKNTVHGWQGSSPGDGVGLSDGSSDA